MTTKEIKILSAAVFGTLAFNAGMQRIPALDKNLEPLLAGNQIGESICDECDQRLLVETQDWMRRNAKPPNS